MLLVRDNRDLERRLLHNIKLGDIPVLRPDLGKCWGWTKATAEGYGVISVKNRLSQAHRIAYELWIDKIPSGLVIDHLCRNTICINPKHLEPVTVRENILRGVGGPAVNSKKTHCIRGHLLQGDNLFVSKKGKRWCKICRRGLEAKYRSENRKKR